MSGDRKFFYVGFILEAAEIARENLNTKIISVVRHLNFSPAVVGDFYLDGLDYEGLDFWYEDAMRSEDELKAKTDK